MDLAMIWASVIAFAVFAYVVMDGFDLGIGILFPYFAAGKERDQAMNSIAPYWDGNETWLVMGGGGLFAVFPLAYSILLPATYPLVIAMLLGLIFRGVAFEYRGRDPRHERIWDMSFCVGSIVAASAQGMILGTILQGIKVADRQYAGGSFDWLTPFTLLTGAGVVAGYTLLGLGWLIWRTEGALQEKARAKARSVVITVLVLISLVSLATLFLQESYWQRWLAFPNILIVLPVPVLTALAAWATAQSLNGTKDYVPFFMALAIFLMGFLGLAISLFPNILPPSVSIQQAAAPDESLRFLLPGALVVVPMILGYTGWAYWVFRGKFSDEIGYH